MIDESDLPTPNPLLDAALHYAAAGLAVFPLHGKVPRAGSAGVKDATTDQELIRSWWTEQPQANVGIATGATSGLVALDVDPRNGGHESLKAVIAEHGRPPVTARASTGGGGLHLLFAHPGSPIKNSTSRIAAGLDIKADGGYIVAPPSIHPETGKPYEWVKDLSTGFAPMPGWLLEHIKNAQKPQVIGSDQPIGSGQRNATLATMAGAMRRRGMSQAAIEAALLEENAGKCNPPLDDDEVRNIAASIARYEPEQATASKRRPEDTREWTEDELARESLPPLQWAIPYLLPAGLAILAGRPKIGKSWMALQWAREVAAGVHVMGKYEAKQGDVLYLGLEDSPRRLQDRLLKLRGDVQPTSRLHLRTWWPRIDEGCIEELVAWISDHPNARMIVIDILKKIKPGPKAKESRQLYDIDYETVSGLVDVAKAHNVAIVVVHHTRKTEAEDVIDEINGSTGLGGGADCTMILKRKRTEDEGKLFITGRDVEEWEMGVSLNMRPEEGKVGWLHTGQAAEVTVSKERQAILEALTQKPGMRPSELADVVGQKSSTVRHLLFKMVPDQQVQEQSGRYFATGGNGGNGVTQSQKRYPPLPLEAEPVSDQELVETLGFADPALPPLPLEGSKQDQRYPVTPLPRITESDDSEGLAGSPTNLEAYRAMVEQNAAKRSEREHKKESHPRPRVRP